MALTEVIRVFVASPSELAEERNRLEEVIVELNSTWGETLGIRLDLIKWETHAYPGFGCDPQKVINEEIRDAYDIFVGVLWARFGTPTTTAGSGTEEEFRRAFRRYSQDPSSVKIMFYFKEDLVSPGKLDPEQLSKVHRFRSELGALGGLSWSYEGVDQFVNLTRVHLSKQVQAWKKDRAGTTGRVESTSSPALAPKEILLDDEYGYLDLMEIIEDNFGEVGKTLTQITNAVDTLGKKTQQRTQEIEAGAVLDQGSKIRFYKKVTNALAEDMDDFVARIEVETPIFSKLFHNGTDAMGRLAPMVIELAGGEKQKMRDAALVLNGLSASIVRSLGLTTQFRDVIRNLPRATARFAKSKEKTIAALDALIKELSTSVGHSTALLKTVEALVQD